MLLYYKNHAKLLFINEKKLIIMEKSIKISSKDIQNMVTECIKKILKEERITLANNVPPEVHEKYLKFFKNQNPELDPSGFEYIGNRLTHNGKKKKKKPVISKPDNMSIEEYYKNVVIPNKPELADKEQEYTNEQWLPVQNIGRYFNGEPDFSSYYMVSNFGRLKIINLKDATRSDIVRGYDAPTRNAMQFHLNGYGDDGSSMKTCPDVKYIVADAWLEPHDMKQFKVIHKDGDYHNNNVNNLQWVPRVKR